MADKLNRTHVEEFLENLSRHIEQDMTIFLIGGCALCLKNLKDATVDMDIVVLSRKDFSILSKGISKMGYAPADKELLKEAVYKNAVVVFEKGAGRIDLFIKSIVGMLDFSDRMVKRAETFFAR